MRALCAWLRKVVVAGLALAAAWQFGSAGYIHAKAVVAQVLLENAWTRTLEGEHAVKPWGWSDTWPVARLRFPAERRTLLVLAGASGRTLAFGPGHVSGTPMPGEGGNSVIVGHRDTHFAVLEELRPGDPVQVELPGRRMSYVVVKAFVVDQSDVGLLRDTGHDELTLITCYPFDAIRPGGPLRYVVRAEAVGEIGAPAESLVHM